MPAVFLKQAFSRQIVSLEHADLVNFSNVRHFSKYSSLCAIFIIR